MPGVIKNNLGTVTITEDIIASIAGMAAIENYGIVGMASKSTKEGFWELLKKENIKKGVKAQMIGEAIGIDLFVMVEYGVSINAVASNVISNATYRIKELTGIDVAYVNVHVEGVRVER